MPLSSLAAGPDQRAGLVIGYGMISAADVRLGLALLRDALSRA